MMFSKNVRFPLKVKAIYLPQSKNFHKSQKFTQTISAPFSMSATVIVTSTYLATTSVLFGEFDEARFDNGIFCKI